MKTIATLTVNPTIDVTYDVKTVHPTHKIRTKAEHYEPGGGGINVARVFARLGGRAHCYYLSGGATGPALDGILDLHRLPRTQIPIAGHTRIASAVFEESSRKEYRFTPVGPVVTEAEWQTCLDTVAKAECDYMVLSGSLCPGIPADFYARIAELMAKRGIPTILDTSGDALLSGLSDKGHVLLVKPSHGELQQLIGRPLTTRAELAEAAQSLVHSGRAQMIAVTMGHDGAILADKDGACYLPAPDIQAQSTVGAGDSFLAAMLYGMASGQPVKQAFQLAVAAGSAAVLTTGTGLAYPEDIARLQEMLPEPGPVSD